MEQIKVFISYSWDDDEHKNWVLGLGQKLTERGFHVILDQFDLFTGKNMTHFMERSIDESDKALLILTPVYKDKADNRKSGVGYEYSMITQELYKNQDSWKFLPIVRKGTYEDAAPKFIGTLLSSDMTRDEGFEKSFEELVLALQNIPPVTRTTSRISSTPFLTNSLIDHSLNAKRIGLKNYAHWAFEIRVNSLSTLSLPEFFKLLIDHRIFNSQDKVFLPFVFGDNFKKSHVPKIIYELPLQPYMGVSNWAITDILYIDKAKIAYEFSEYRDDFFLLHLSQPLTSLFYLLENLKKIHTSIKTLPSITIKVKFKANIKALFYQPYSPFDCGTAKYGSYRIPNDEFEMESTVTNFDSESQFKFYQGIYHYFLEENINVKDPYLNINKDNFKKLISSSL